MFAILVQNLSYFLRGLKEKVLNVIITFIIVLRVLSASKGDEMELHEEMIKKFISLGYIAVIGYNSVGDEIYQFTEKFYEEHPDIVDYIKTKESDVISSLWFKNFIEIKMDDEGNSYIYLTDKSIEWYDTTELNHEEKSMMYLIYSTVSYSDKE